ncbi:hypothetical protein C2845_PM15G07090 [Panicum miliaceum]|uniref:Tudor domain-containing protein n=1 Tax=Panicum miliaceum TaxID=4540 RepID=A0A3L6Q9I8_PANMI|nr:hypothetical protein C2845_PM15G07090 [Panicum miliaceum]
MLGTETKRKLKNAELQAKKEQLRIWMGFQPPVTNTTPIHNQKFMGKVIEVVNGCCIIVVDDTLPVGSPLAERRVHVSMEYSRRINISNGQVVADRTNVVDAKILDYGSVFLPSQVGSSGNLLGANVAKLLLSRGFVDITRHQDTKRGHTTVPAKKARDFFHLLQRNKRHSAVVEYIFSGYRFKLTIPNETSTIAFSFSCVRCPGKNEPYSVFQRDVKIEIEAVDRTGTFLGSLWESKNNMAYVLFEAGLAKLSSFGLDRISDAQTFIRAEKYAQQKKLKVIVTEVIGGGKFYAQIVGDRRLDNIRQELASMKFNDESETLIAKDSSDSLEVQDQPKHTPLDTSEVGVEPKNHVQVPLCSTWSSLFKDKADTLKDEVPVGTLEPEDLSANVPSDAVPFNPTKGDVVLAQFTLDNSWNRAMILSEHQGPTEREFEVFYIDYGNQELFRLAFITVPNLTDDLGEQAARYLSMVLLDNEREFKATVEERGSVGARQEGQGTGEVLIVTLLDEDAESSINAAKLENGLAQMERKRPNSWDRRGAVKNLEQFQEHAKKERRGIWCLRGTDVPDKSAEDGEARDANDEDLLPPAQAQPPSRGFDLIGLIASKTQNLQNPVEIEHVVGDISFM